MTQCKPINPIPVSPCSYFGGGISNIKYNPETKEVYADGVLLGTGKVESGLLRVELKTDTDVAG